MTTHSGVTGSLQAKRFAITSGHNTLNPISPSSSGHNALNPYILLFVFGWLLIATSCRSHKSVTEPPLLDNSPQWVQLNIPLKVAIKSPQKLSVSGRLYMRRDLDIAITLRVFGMEVAYLYADADSIYAIDKIHKYYVAEPTSSLLASASLSISDIQDILLGINVPNPLSYSHNNRTFTLRYSDPTAVDAITFMQQLIIVGTASSGRNTTDNLSDISPSAASSTFLDASITYDFAKLKWETPANIRRTPPSNYTRIPASSLIKSLNK